MIPLHTGKGGSVAAALGRSTDYVKNPEKTDGGEWVTAYECDPLIADDEFLFSKNQYAAITGRDYGKRDVLAYHLRQSFKPGEVDPATANRIGYELAMKLTRGNHAFICCTHVDKAHVHSHIIFNSTSLDCTKKFRNFKGSSFVVRRISDQLCVENRLSIIESPKPSKGKDYGDWLGGGNPPSLRDKLEQIIDSALESCNDFNSFLAAMQGAGCEVKQGKHLAFKAPGQARFIRCKSLGADYTEDGICERISGRRIVVPKSKITTLSASSSAATRRPNLLIDIEAKLQQARSPGYEHWARLYNLKESAKTLIFLKERGLDNYDLLVEKTDTAKNNFHKGGNRRKEISDRLKEIAELQKYIGQYSKTREVYSQYRDSKWSKKFAEAHHSDIALHKAAKKYFDSLNLKKLPTINMLKKEYAMLSAEQKKINSGYKENREEMIAMLMAKQNVDRILFSSPTQTKNLERGAR